MTTLGRPVLPYLRIETIFNRRLNPNTVASKSGPIFSQSEILLRLYGIDNESCVPTHTFLVWTAHHHPGRG